MNLGRTRFKKEIVSDYMQPLRSSNKVIIIASGVPGYPEKKEVMKMFSKEGFWVFIPRYRGTWESGGIFLSQSPHIDVEDIISELSKGFTDLLSGKQMVIKSPKVYLIGSSFGGPAVLFNSKNPLVKKVLAISPVIDWRIDSKTEPMSKWDNFIKEGFTNCYRMKKNGWMNLLKGDMYNPATTPSLIDPKKVFFIHAKDDEEVLPGATISMSSQLNIPLKLLNKGGHLGTSLLAKPAYKNLVLKFFK